MLNTVVKRYSPANQDELYNLLKREGTEWKDYWQGEGWVKFQKALAGSITYVILEDGVLCGFARCRDDDGYGIYVYDLLVDKDYRGKEYGRLLMEQVCRDYPDDTVYVMSDVDTYYSKLGYQKEGTIFIVKARM